MIAASVCFAFFLNGVPCTTLDMSGRPFWQKYVKGYQLDLKYEGWVSPEDERATVQWRV